MPETASVEALRAFNTARSARKRAAVLSTLADLSGAGSAHITKSAVARAAGVSRQFIHSHPDLVQRIEKAGTQAREHRSGGAPNPDRTVTGLRTQLDTLAAKVARQKQTIEEQAAQLGRSWRNASATWARNWPPERSTRKKSSPCAWTPTGWHRPTPT